VSRPFEFADVVAEVLALVGRPVVVTLAFAGGQPATLAAFTGELTRARQVGDRCGSEALLLAVGEGSLILYADVFGGAIREADALVVRQGTVDVVVEAVT
jgi:hypothetical protein